MEEGEIISLDWSNIDSSILAYLYQVLSYQDLIRAIPNRHWFLTQTNVVWKLKNMQMKWVIPLQPSIHSDKVCVECGVFYCLRCPLSRRILCPSCRCIFVVDSEQVVKDFFLSEDDVRHLKRVREHIPQKYGRETYKYLKSEIMKIAIKKFGESEFEKRQATRCMVKNTIAKRADKLKSDALNKFLKLCEASVKQQLKDGKKISGYRVPMTVK